MSSYLTTLCKFLMKHKLGLLKTKAFIRVGHPLSRKMNSNVCTSMIGGQVNIFYRRIIEELG